MCPHLARVFPRPPQHPNTVLQFGSGSQLFDASGTINAASGLIVGQNNTIAGNLVTYGKNLVRVFVCLCRRVPARR